MLGGRKKIVLSGVIAMIGMFFVSCSSEGRSNLALYTVERGAFDDVLRIEGFTESVSSISLTCPQDADGSIEYLVESGTMVKKGDTLCIIDDPRIEERYENWMLSLENVYADFESAKANAKMELALLEAQVRTNEAETLIAGLDSVQLLYLSPTERRIKELQMEQAVINRSRLAKQITAQKAIQQADIKRIESQISQVERRVEKQRKLLESLVILAPKDGLAIRARRWPWSTQTWLVGDNVWDGRAVVTMPSVDSVKVLIYAQETEYKRIDVGDSIEYTFDAMPENRAWGRITKLSPMGLKRTEGSEVKTFEIEASVDSLLQPIDPGLSANCRVYLQHVPDTLVVPTVCVYHRDSTNVVYVRKGKKYEEREVKLSITTPRSSVIAEGLHEGEQITLIKPDDKHIL
ncbi:MAG: efflux RND transporter periplasmic adaptor subunit [Bacteroidaceae bacterium]|nr:efflux RND transporter periplasmic adaptor subunit [Bacteroidaceae bacterium]